MAKSRLAALAVELGAQQPPDVCGADRPGQPVEFPPGARRHRRQQAGPGQSFDLQVAQE
jgi:hypothetical protein